MGGSKKKVLIIGAGIAGLAAYLALDKKKFEVEIIEKKPGFKRLGYALIFMPLGVGVLKKLGFTNQQVASLGKNVHENKVKDKNGKVIMITSYRGLAKKFDRYMIVTREKLYRLLEKRIAKKDIQFGITPKSFTSTARKKIKVQFTGKKKAGEYDVVIGADGIHSNTRQILFPGSKPKHLGLSLVWGWIPRKKGLYPQPGGAIGNELGGAVGFFNSGEKTRSCMAFFIKSAEVPKDIAPNNYQSFLRKALKDLKGPVPKILKHLPAGEDMYLHDDYELDIKKWHKGNIVLVGDAAHARSVLTGAGSALALEDALVLGHHLNREMKIKAAIGKYFFKQNNRVKQLAMAQVKTYIQDQDGLVEFLEKFFAESLAYAHLE